MSHLSRSIQRWLKSITRLTIFSMLCIISLGLTSAAFALPAEDPAGEMIYAVTAGKKLVQFSSADSCTLISRQKITGLQADEKLHGIDFRPANGKLYGLGSTGRLYTIDLVTAVATQIGSPFATALDGDTFGFDFNPTVDRIRVVSNTGQNLRIHPDTGAVVFVDGSLAYAGTDLNAGTAPAVSAAAYTNPDNDPTTGTTLYDIDSALDILVTQSPPNAGTLNTVGALGISFRKPAGFDISLSGMAYAALQTNSGGCGTTQLATLDLATGNATLVGSIGTSEPIYSIAVQTTP
jgi:hypothetical protein